MIVAPYSRARRRAMLDLPAAVGPQMTGTLSPAKAPVELVPRELHDCRTTVNVVRREIRVSKRREQRPHFRERQRLASLDCRFARNGCREMLVTCCRTGNTVTRQRVERFAQTSLGVEPCVRHGHTV